MGPWTWGVGVDKRKERYGDCWSVKSLDHETFEI